MERGTTVVAKFQTQTSAPLPSIVVSPEVANSIFLGETQSAVAIFNASYGQSLPASFALSAAKTMTLSLTSKSEIVPTQNVVAIWEGSDPVLKDEYVAVGAHYDHVGICPPVGTDNICNGADDDGSGTTAILSMAEALSQKHPLVPSVPFFLSGTVERKRDCGVRVTLPSIQPSHSITLSLNSTST